MTKPRARDLGLDFPGICGQSNSLVDVPGVLVGFKTIIQGEGAASKGDGPVRTGVTAILPRGFNHKPESVWAGINSLNGNGEMTGSHWVRDAGYFAGPICITNTHSVGMVHHAATRWMISHYADEWRDQHLWAMPIVAETYDGVLNDINGQHITMEDALEAINNASDKPVSEGNVGGGTGMICYEFKGGTGSASRKIQINDSDYIIAALVQANHGVREWFTPLGVPVGKYMSDNKAQQSHEMGSIIVILATNAPLLPGQLERIARRASIGIGRGGTPGGNNSGDIFLAFSTANAQPVTEFPCSHHSLSCIDDSCLDALYLGAVESVEESVINAMVAAEDMTMVKPYGETCRAIDQQTLVRLLKEHGRIIS